MTATGDGGGGAESGGTAGGKPASREVPRRAPANPAPRPALKRVQPLPSDDATAPRPLEPAGDGPSSAAAQQAEATAGRDVLIPEAARPGRGRARPAPRPPAPAIPALTELMPPARPNGRQRKHGHHERPAEGAEPAPRPSRHAKTKGGKDRPAKGKGGERDAGKQVELVVPMSKALRKRLRSRADELGVSSEVAVARLVEVWLDA